MANPNPFTPEEVAQILEAFFATVGTRQYVGARYVPIFGRKGEESIIWDNSAPYEPLTIVLYQGNSYTSRQYVPAGVEITNEEFWAQTGNYNAQVEQYRNDVMAFKDEIEQTINDAIADISGYSGYINLNKEGNFGTDEGTDVTSLLQSAIDSVPEGFCAFLEKGTYIITHIDLKSDVAYDFGDSTFVCTEPNAIRAYGSLRTTLGVTATTNPNSNIFNVTNTEDVNVGDLIVISDPTELANEGRSYYYKGFTTIVVEKTSSTIRTLDTVPYDINGGIVSVYDAFTGEIKNVGNAVYNGTRGTEYFIDLNAAINVKVSNCHFTNWFYTLISMQYCHSVVVSNCSFIYGGTNLPEQTENIYFVAARSSTHTITCFCKCDAPWHSWTSGNHETPLNNYVIYCDFSSEHMYSLLDHGNAIGTTVAFCTLSGIGIAGLGRVIGCTIRYIDSVSRGIRLLGESDLTYATYTFSDCTFLGDMNLITQTTDQTQATLSAQTLNVSNCVAPNNFVFLNASFIKNANMSNCTNMLYIYTNTDANDDVVYIKNCTVNNPENNPASNTLNIRASHLIVDGLYLKATTSELKNIRIYNNAIMTNIVVMYDHINIRPYVFSFYGSGVLKLTNIYAIYNAEITGSAFAIHTNSTYKTIVQNMYDLLFNINTISDGFVSDSIVLNDPHVVDAMRDNGTMYKLSKPSDGTSVTWIS